MFFPSSRALLSAAVIGLSGSAAAASPVSSISFNDGSSLHVQSVVGTGANTADEVINLPSGPNVAWEYKFDGSVNGWQMLSDIAAADSYLQLTAPYFAAFSEHYVENMQYGAVSGNLFGWNFDSGTYNPADVSSANPQGMTWNNRINIGIDQLNISNGEFVGWVDQYPSPQPLPVLPTSEAAVPEPTAVSMLLIGSSLVIRRRRQARNI